MKYRPIAFTEHGAIMVAEGTKLRVIAYRPDYIGPTDEEAHLGQKLMLGMAP